MDSFCSPSSNLVWIPSPPLLTVAGRSARRGDGQGGAGARRRALPARVWLTAARCGLSAWRHHHRESVGRRPEGAQPPNTAGGNTTRGETAHGGTPPANTPCFRAVRLYQSTASYASSLTLGLTLTPEFGLTRVYLPPCIRLAPLRSNPWLLGYMNKPLL